MGFLDKAKAGLSNVGNYTEQKADEARFNGKISDKNREKSKALEEASALMYEAYKGGATEISDEIKALFEKAIGCESEIEKLEAEKQEMISKSQATREARRMEASSESNNEQQ